MTQLETTWSPPVVLQTLELESGAIHVAREDLLVGGTKQRAILPFLRDLIGSGVKTVIYASPFCGYAQVALAACGKALGMPIVLFCEQDQTPGTSPGLLHPFSQLAASMGAHIYVASDLAQAEAQAEHYCQRSHQDFKIPLGFAEPRYLNHMREKLREQYLMICSQLGQAPPRIWLPVGSGTLAKIFLSVVGPETQLLCIGVRVLNEEDPRIDVLKKNRSVVYRTAEEKFYEPSRVKPPLPSNIHYDAKLWSWIQKDAQKNDLWWNVAQ